MSSILISERPKFKEWYWNKNFLVICTSSHCVHNTYKFLEIPCSDVRGKKRKNKHDWQWFRSCEFFFLKSNNFFKVTPDSLSMKRLKDLVSELMMLIHVSSIFFYSFIIVLITRVSYNRGNNSITIKGGTNFILKCLIWSQFIKKNTIISCTKEILKLPKAKKKLKKKLNDLDLWPTWHFNQPR